MTTWWISDVLEQWWMHIVVGIRECVYTQGYGAYEHPFEYCK